MRGSAQAPQLEAVRRASDIMKKLKALIKFLRSFFIRNWTVEDYPIYIKRQDRVPPESRYCAQILNWPTGIGLGETREKK